MHSILEILSCNLPSHHQSTRLPIYTMKTLYWPGANTDLGSNKKKCLKIAKQPSSNYCTRLKIQCKAGGYFSCLPPCTYVSLIISRQVLVLPISKFWPENWWHVVRKESVLNLISLLQITHSYLVTTDDYKK